MAFDLTSFAREMLSVSGHAELLRCACDAATNVSGEPAFAAHVLPGRDWDRATVVSARAHAASSSAVRSALYALYRQVSLRGGALHVDREDKYQSVFRGLLQDSFCTLDALPLHNHGHQVVGVLVAARDSTADAATQVSNLSAIAALTGPAMDSGWRYTLARRDQERLQLFSETSDETLWDWDIDQNEMWWAGNLDKLFGDAPPSKRPDWRPRHIHSDDVSRVVASFEAARAGDLPAWSEQYRLHRHDETPLEVREHVYFLRETSGRAYRAVGTVRDISALQQLLAREQEAHAASERANIVKDEFLAMLGHELRNPLAPILAALELLEQRTSRPDEPLAIMRRQAMHLVRLVDDLLDVSRISRGTVELVLERVPVETVVTRAMEMTAPLLEQKRHHVEIELAKNLDLRADAARMAQVLSNLIANAAKYTDPGGRVRVTARAEGGRAIIRIRDNGIGLTAEFLPRLFEMFTQEQQTIDRSRGGLGLGLSIVKNIVQLHDGTVQAYSEGLGHGTVMELRLPLAEPDTPIPREVAPMASPRAAARVCEVLVVDDNEDAVALLSELLRDSGHTVRVTYAPTDALRLLEEKPSDLALVDIGLPEMDGYELARRIRARPQCATIKLIALTGYGQASDRAHALAAGFDAHLVKPVSRTVLDQTIAELML